MVILVDQHDNEIGAMEKLEVHEKGLLHRAFSVFVFNQNGEMLLQQRALHKYHSGGLWTNTCCSHPEPEENTKSAAQRRLIEEMGMDLSLDFAFSFIYKANFDNGLIEHELDHVYYAYSDMKPDPNPEEVANYQYKSPELILKDIADNPHLYTEWFKLSFAKLCEHLNQ